jgi:hypothetical protein
VTIPAVLAPVFVQVALTFALLFWMAELRRRALMRSETPPESIALGQKGWPVQTQKVSNAFQNQFELPVLFYVLVILALFTRKADLAFVVLSWVFVVTRCVHAAIHTGPNIVLRRGLAYGAGGIVLVGMWAIFTVRVLLGL